MGRRKISGKLILDAREPKSIETRRVVIRYMKVVGMEFVAVNFQLV
jgi:hypothetical protein